MSCSRSIVCRLAIVSSFLVTRTDAQAHQRASSEIVPPAEQLSAFRRKGLELHNELRALHGTPALDLAEHLSHFAQKWAHHLAKLDKLEHSEEKDNPDFGENLYSHKAQDTRPETIAKDAVKTWYDESHHYSYHRPGYHESTGHLTQMIWKATKHLGMGMATSSSGTTYVVASYEPMGNFNVKSDKHKTRKYFRENVLPKSHAASAFAFAGGGGATASPGDAYASTGNGDAYASTGQAAPFWSSSLEQTTAGSGGSTTTTTTTTTISKTKANSLKSWWDSLWN